MNKLIKITVSSVLVSVFLFGGSQFVCSRTFVSTDTVNVAAFGLLPDTRENATPFVQKALEACEGKTNVTLVFPKGRYDFWPQHCVERFYPESNTTNKGLKRLAVLIDKMDGLTVDGCGSDFVFHDRMQPFTVDSSRNIMIRNLTIDWDIPLTAQAVVLQAADDYVDLGINKYESPCHIENGRLVFTGEGWKSPWGGTMEFDRDTRIVVPQTGDQGSLRYEGEYRAEELERGVVRVHARFTRKPAVGNLLVLRHSERDHAGVFVVDSRNVRIENMDMYHNCGLGILSQYSEDLTFCHVNCVPNEKKGRILAGHDDGFHYSNCKGDIVVENCIFHALMDDPINVHGTAIRVMEKRDDYTLRCRFMHEQSAGMIWARAGETVGFIKGETMQTIARGTVKSYDRVGDYLFDITFDEPVPKEIVFKDALENLTWTCNVLIRDSHFKSCRARGVLISTPGKVRIENNIFESSGSAILIAGDANFWFETGAVKDVLITKNVFRAPCMTSMYQFCEGVISIYPEIPGITAKTPAFHSNIRITDNEFHLFDYPVLYALSVENIEFSGNRLIRSHDFEPFHRRKDGLTFEACRKVTVRDNTSEGDILGKTIRLVRMPRKECRADRNVFIFAK